MTPALPADLPASLSLLGEDNLVALLTRNFNQPDPARRVLLGPGDDCALLAPPPPGLHQLLKTDTVIEGVHFHPGEDPRRVGWKALCRPVSDIAAMGGLPRHALVTLALPPALTPARARALYDGIEHAARTHHIAIVGGETSRTPGPLLVSVTLLGEIEPHRHVTRSGGQPGDILLVTGHLGGSIAAKHLDFTPRLHEARWLTEHFTLHALMDLSDGLAADLPRLAAASHCSHHLHLHQLPLTPGSTIQQALSDGEDYELLLALPPADLPRLLATWPENFPNLPITPIGHLLPPGQPSTPLPQPAFTHFPIQPSTFNLQPSTLTTSSPAETTQAGHLFATALPPGPALISLTGDLGAGKTHFVKGIAQALGHDPASITSPTFALLHEHTGGPGPDLLHLDLYRLDTPQQALDLGLDELLQRPHAIIVLEWADKFPGLLPTPHHHIHLAHLSPHLRQITITSPPGPAFGISH